MTLREGNLEAPTRHPIDWQSPDYRDEGKAFAEMERVFDICHGCRRCVSLCQSFPTLFDLIDASADGEVHGVAKKDYAKVVDQCYLCDLCYMTKCPYVPPHPWNVDFPHLMLRAKAIKFGKGEVGAGERCSRRPTCMASSPAFRSSCRRSTRPTGRGRCARCSTPRSASIPMPGCRRWRRKRFRSAAAKKGSATRVVDGERSPGKVALFATCYVNYNEPGIGHDLVALLEHNDIPYEVVDEGELLRHAQARARRSRRRGQAQGEEHPGAGALRARGLRDPDRRSRRAR